MSNGHSTRRAFNKQLALLAAVPLVAAQEPIGAAQEPDPPTPAEILAASARALTDIVRLRHGKHLSEAQLKRVRQRIEGNLRAGAVLRRFPLRNADEPDFVFGAEILG